MSETDQLKGTAPVLSQCSVPGGLLYLFMINCVPARVLGLLWQQMIVLLTTTIPAESTLKAPRTHRTSTTRTGSLSSFQVTVCTLNRVP